MFDLLKVDSLWLIEILGKEKRYGRSGRFLNSLDVPIEVRRKSVNQLASKAAFQGSGGRAVIAYAANDLAGRGFNCDRNTAGLGRKRVPRGIRDEFRDDQLRSPTTLGTEHDRLCNCQMQFNIAVRKSARSHGVAKLSQIDTQISGRSRQRRP
jgi:hypothetical protein